MESTKKLWNKKADDSQRSEHFERAFASLPEVGQSFLGFRLLAELGAGAFGRVFVAHQESLAQRRVALKISIDVDGEEFALAQLQHTHIVPIYSVHYDPPLRAVCMPYFGPTTFADVFARIADDQRPPTRGQFFPESIAQRNREFQAANPEAKTLPTLQSQYGPKELSSLQSFGTLSYVESGLWIAVRLAEALMHSHQRGILHQDLKPANVLLTNEGVPMLLDFNLSQDVNALPFGSSGPQGGTPAYMAPESLAALNGETVRSDGRGDVYSFGVILFQLFTGQFPFTSPTSSPRPTLTEMIAERGQLPPMLQPHNRDVSPALEAVVRHCLESDPDRRYESMSALHDDLQRQRQNRVLIHIPEPSIRERGRKLMRRHPKLFSPVIVGSVVCALLSFVIAFGAWNAWDYFETRGIAAEGAKEAAEKSKRDADEQREQSQLARLDAKKREELALKTSNAASFYLQFRDGAAMLRHLEDNINMAELLPIDFPGTGQAKLRLNDELRRAAKILDGYHVRGSDDWLQREPALYLPDKEKKQLKQTIANLLHQYVRGRIILLQETTSWVDQEAIWSAAANMLTIKAVWTPAIADHVEIAVLSGLNERAAKLVGSTHVPRFALRNKRDLIRILGKHFEMPPLKFASNSPLSAGDAYQLAYEQARAGDLVQAVRTLRDVVQSRPDHFSPWFLKGICHQLLDEAHDAIQCYTTCVVMDPTFLPAYFNRGRMVLELGDANPAIRDFSRVIRADERFTAAYVARATAYAELGRMQPALHDLNTAIKQNPNRIGIRFLRSKYRKQANDNKGATQDWTALRQISPATTEDYLYLALVYQNENPQKALQWFDLVLQRSPHCQLALFGKAKLLATHSKRPDEALKVLDTAIRYFPNQREFLARRGLMLARIGNVEQAHKQAQQLLEMKSSPEVFYQVARIYAQSSLTRPKDADEAAKYLLKAVADGYGWDILVRDENFAPLHKHIGFQQAIRLIAILRQAKGERK